MRLGRERENCDGSQSSFSVASHAGSFPIERAAEFKQSSTCVHRERASASGAKDLTRELWSKVSLVSPHSSPLYSPVCGGAESADRTFDMVLKTELCGSTVADRASLHARPHSAPPRAPLPRRSTGRDGSSKRSKSSVPTEKSTSSLNSIFSFSAPSRVHHGVATSVAATSLDDHIARHHTTTPLSYQSQEILLRPAAVRRLPLTKLPHRVLDAPQLVVSLRKRASLLILILIASRTTTTSTYWIGPRLPTCSLSDFGTLCGSGTALQAQFDASVNYETLAPLDRTP